MQVPQWDALHLLACSQRPSCPQSGKQASSPQPRERMPNTDKDMPSACAVGAGAPGPGSALSLFYFLSLNKINLALPGKDETAATAPCPGPLGVGLPLGSGPRRRSFGKDTAGTRRGWHLPHLSPEARTCPLALFGISEAGGSLPARPGAGLGLASPGRTGLSSRASPVSSLGSLLVVIGGVGKGELEAVGLGQQQADVLVIPVGRGQVLQEE